MGLVYTCTCMCKFDSTQIFLLLCLTECGNKTNLHNDFLKSCRSYLLKEKLCTVRSLRVPNLHGLSQGVLRGYTRTYSVAVKIFKRFNIYTGTSRRELKLNYPTIQVILPLSLHIHPIWDGLIYTNIKIDNILMAIVQCFDVQ